MNKRNTFYYLNESLKMAKSDYETLKGKVDYFLSENLTKEKVRVIDRMYKEGFDLIKVSKQMSEMQIVICELINIIYQYRTKRGGDE